MKLYKNAQPEESIDWKDAFRDQRDMTGIAYWCVPKLSYLNNKQKLSIPLHILKEYADFFKDTGGYTRKHASVAIIIKNGLILGISRKEKPDHFGLVGGTLEEGESNVQTMLREVKEEANITVTKSVPIYYDFEYDETSIWRTVCYYAISYESDNIANNEGFNLKWCTVEEITKTISAFPEFNKNAINKFKEKFPNVFLKER